MKQIALDIGLPTGPTLDGFMPGPNQEVWQHLRLWLGKDNAAARSPVPTYIWGDSGSGKSHLLRAIKDALIARGERVGWLDPNADDGVEFSPAWSAVFMDDVHAYSAVQQHMAFNWFVNAASGPDGRPRSVLAAGRWPPADLLIRDDLRSRLGWGHVFHLKVLDESERAQVLRQQAHDRGIHLTSEVVDFLLTRFSRDLSTLSLLLDQLDQYGLQTQRAVTIPLVRAMIESQ